MDLRVFGAWRQGAVSTSAIACSRVACWMALLLASSLFFAADAAAQHPTHAFVVAGRVTDAQTGEGLPGVHVRVPDSPLGTATDREGRYRLVLDVPPARLLFSFVGYEAREVPVTGEVLDVALEPARLDLSPVVVSASRRAQAREEVPVAISALATQAIQETRAKLLPELLSKLPGVHMTDLGNEQHNMSIRQPLSYKALYAYLEDGVPIRPIGIFNHNALIEINAAGMERIEVVRGPSSSLYGANAVGGAVNFLTPSPTLAPSGGAQLRADNGGYRRADLSASATRGALGVWAGGYAAQQQDGFAEHSDFDKVSLTARADYAFTPRTHLLATLTTNHLDTDTNGALDSLSFYTGNLSSLQTFTYRRVEATRLTARLNHVWNPRHATEATVFARDNTTAQLPHYRIRNDRTDPSRATGEKNDQSFTSLGAQVQHAFYLPATTLTVGGLVDRSPSRYVAEFLDIQRDPATGQYLRYTASDSLLTRYDVRLLNTAAFVQADVRVLEKLRLSGALRYDVLAYDYDNHLPPTAFSGAPDATNTYRHLSPRLGATLDLGAQRGVYANFGQGFVPPEVGELYQGVKVPTLRPAFFDSYETGGWASFFAGRVRAEVSLYRMDGRDEILNVRLDDGATENRNAGRTRHEGVEYALTLAPLRGLTFYASGTNARHTYRRFEDGGVTFDGNRMEAAPSWMFNAEATYHLPFLPAAYASAEVRRLSAYYMDAANTQKYPGYTLWNARAGYRVGPVDVFASVLNVADVRYATIALRSRFGQQYTLGAPRTLSLGLAYRIGR